MLVLMRKQGEQVLIGDNIYLTVLSVEGNRVRLGLTAPRDVSILRQELGSSCGEHPLTEQPPGSAAVAHSLHD